MLRKALLLISLLVVTACQTIEVDERPRLQAERLLILPTTALHEEMQSSVRQADAVLQQALQKAGYQLLTVKPDELTALTEKALEVSGAVYNPDIGHFLPLNKNAYYKALGALLQKQQDYQLLVVPELLIRNAAIVEGDVSWDDANQKLMLEGFEVGLPLPRRAKGLSLRLTSYTAHGQLYTDKFHGVSVPYSIHYHAGEPVFQLKPALFSDSELEDGVQKAVKALVKRTK